MIYLNANISIIAINVNDLIIPTKKQRLLYLGKKARSLRQIEHAKKRKT